MHRLNLPNTGSLAIEPLQLVHADVWGPATSISFNGEKYFVVFIDEFFNNCWVYALKAKSDVLPVLIPFIGRKTVWQTSKNL